MFRQIRRLFVQFVYMFYTINVTHVCSPRIKLFTFQTDVCQIEGVCHDNGISKSINESCLQCSVANDQFAWTKLVCSEMILLTD